MVAATTTVEGSGDNNDNGGGKAKCGGRSINKNLKQ